MAEINVLPPVNGAHEEPERWENADDKDRRGIRKVWEAVARVAERVVASPKGFDAAKSAEVASDADKRLKARKVAAPVKGDRRGF